MGVLNASFLAFKTPMFLAFQIPTLVIIMPNFGTLNVKRVLGNFLKVKRHFWHLNPIIWHLAFMKLTPGSKTVHGDLAGNCWEQKRHC